MLIDNETYVPGKQAEAEPPLRKLKPSEAMRIGAALRPQCKGQAFKNGGSCAIGAMWEGYGFPHPGDDNFNKQTEIYVWSLCDLHISGLWQRNDMGGMTREAIADWLEGQGL